MHMKKDKILEFTLLQVYVLLGSFGILLSFADAFYISYNRNVFYFGTVFCTAATTLLYGVKKYKIFAAVAAGVFGNVILSLVRGKEVRKGVQLVINTVLAHVEAYLSGSKPAGSAAAGSYETGLLFFLIIAGTIVAYGIVCVKRAGYTIAVMGAGIAIPFLVGMIPDNVPLVCMVVVILGAAFSKMGGAENKSAYKAGLLGIAVGFLACVIGAFVIQQPLEKTFEKDKAMQEKITSFWWEKITEFSEKDKGKGGVNNGELGRISEFEEDNSEHLEVKAGRKPESRIYLQGYTGTEYTGQKWKSDVRNLSYNMISETVSSRYSMTVTNVSANPAYEYLPYVREYEKLDIQFPADMVEEEADYERFISDEYTKVPRNIREAFRGELAEKVTGTDVNTVIGQVGNMLDEQTSYSKSPGKTPVGKDFAEYFYFENEKGYCSHYATVATLLFRMKSIPARYVAGYVVEPDEFRRHSDGGYEASVTGESAHAWAEIYLSGIGWVPAETTPGYRSKMVAEEQRVEKQTEERQTEERQMEQTQDKEPMAEEKAEKPPVRKADREKQDISEGAKTPKEDRKNIWGYVVAAVAVLGMAGALTMRKRLAHKGQSNMEQKSYNARIRKLFYQTFKKLLAEKTVSEDVALDTVFIDKICENYKEISREEIEKMMDIVYYANFGKEDIGRADYQYARRILLLLEKIK